MPTGDSQVLLSHQILDSFIAQQLEQQQLTADRVYCRSGCDSCCNLAVHASYAESITVAGNLTAKNKTTLAEYIQRFVQHSRTTQTLRDYLKSHRSLIGPCPFLDQSGNCSIYHTRPLSCRALLSTRPPDWCAVDLSELDQWDKQLFTSSLNRRIVSWPTQYLAAPQNRAKELEAELSKEMLKSFGWSLSGNFAIMVWLESEFHFSSRGQSAGEIRDILSKHQLNNPVVLILLESS